MKRRIGYILLLAAICGYLIFSPRYFGGRLKNEAYSEWIRGKREPGSQILNVWHVVDFKPYSGSLGGWLEKSARKYFSAYNGIYYEVWSVSPDEAESMLARGMKPDVVSFAKGRFPGSLFKRTNEVLTKDGAVFAHGETAVLPYCASCRVIVYDPTANADKDELIKEAGTVDQFRAGKAKSCICDLRGAGDLQRASLMGKCPQFEAEPINERTELIQYIGLYRDIEESKLSYACGFIEYVLNVDSQKSIAELGLLPVIKTDVHFEPGWIAGAYRNFDPDDLPDCFE